MDSQPVAATRHRSSPDWLPDLLEWLEGLRQVPENWDGYNAAAPLPVEGRGSPVSG